MACTYGVLAGTLVGAATLAFTKRPGDHLGNIARGASIGLYTGIGLGLYAMYGIPSQEEYYGVSQYSYQSVELPRFTFMPYVSEQNGFDGMQLNWTLTHF